MGISKLKRFLMRNVLRLWFAAFPTQLYSSELKLMSDLYPYCMDKTSARGLVLITPVSMDTVTFT